MASGQHGGVELGVDDGVAPFVLNDQGWPQPVVTKATTTFPINGFGDAAFVFAVDNFFQPGNAMSVTVFAQLNSDPTPTHLVRDSGSRTGTEKGVENQVARIASNCKQTMD